MIVGIPASAGKRGRQKSRRRRRFDAPQGPNYDGARQAAVARFRSKLQGFSPMTALMFRWIRRVGFTAAASSAVLATTATPGQTAAPAPAAAPAPVAGSKVPQPEEAIIEEVNSVEKTDVPIAITYLPGTRGKDTVPVVLLHMYKGDRHEMEGFGLYLQSQGHAVFMPDLRGHGQSTTVVGSDRKLDAASMAPPNYGFMITRDMDCVKRFIVKKHNNAELNADRLVLIGAEMGAQVAVNWAARDWAATDLQGLKQSKDVKAVVLLSPTMNFKSLSLTQALNFPPIQTQISFLLIAGAEDATSARDTRSIYGRLERARPKPAKPEEKTVFIIDEQLKTKLVGSKLLGEKSLGVDGVINEFITLRVVNQILPWKDRTP
jgi:pimeloyl-ACP methyl ester carboxylesterase